MSEIDELKAQMANMLTTMQQQQEIHEQEIKKLKNKSEKYKPDSGTGTSTNIRISNPTPTTDAKAPSTSGYSRCNIIPGDRNQRPRTSGIPGHEPPSGRRSDMVGHHFKKITDEEEELPNWKQFEKLSKKIQTRQTPPKPPRPPRPPPPNQFRQSLQRGFTSTILEIPTISEEEMVDRYVRGLKKRYVLK